MGVNVVYAPVLDLATEPENVSLGIRSFGADPALVGRLGAAFVRGVQGAGVAASIKHFPGLGEVVADSHHGPGVVLPRARISRPAHSCRSGPRSRPGPGSRCRPTSRCPRCPAIRHCLRRCRRP